MTTSVSETKSGPSFQRTAAYVLSMRWKSAVQYHWIPASMMLVMPKVTSSVLSSVTEKRRKNQCSAMPSTKNSRRDHREGDERVEPPRRAGR